MLTENPRWTSGLFMSRQVAPNFIATIFVPVLHLTKAEQQREQNGDTADGLTNIRCGFNVHVTRQ